jgi:hypothetical protein
MTTIQLISIAIASVIVVLLVAALVVTRRRGAQDEEPDEELSGASFLDSPPTDTLHGLGRAEREVEQVPAPATPDEAHTGDIGRSPAIAPPATVADAPGLKQDVHVDDTAEVTRGGEKPATVEDAAPPAAPPERDTPAAVPGPAGPAEGGSAPAPAAARESGPGGRRVPLSQVLVTTSGKMVDLDDPEVRTMLTDLIAFEIDQATLYAQQGQTVDALLQLTEAEKIAHALALDDTARSIREMMEAMAG